MKDFDVNSIEFKKNSIKIDRWIKRSSIKYAWIYQRVLFFCTIKNEIYFAPIGNHMDIRVFLKDKFVNPKVIDKFEPKDGKFVVEGFIGMLVIVWDSGVQLVIGDNSKINRVLKEIRRYVSEKRSE